MEKGSIHVRCPVCNKDFHLTNDNPFQFCPFDAGVLQAVVETPAEIPPKEKVNIVVSWCPVCNVPFRHDLLHENQETHEKECAICHGPVKVIYPLPDKAPEKPATKDDLIIAGIPDMVSDMVIETAVPILMPIAKKKLSDFLRTLL